MCLLLLCGKMYANAAPPSILQFSTVVQQQNSPQQKTSNALNFRKIHHLINVLKGDDLAFEERMTIVESLQSLDSSAKADLIDFLASKNGAIGTTIENNACKHFICSTEELKNLDDSRGFKIKDLLDFWEFVQVQIIPTFLAVSYPLEDPDMFQIRQTIFVALRNKVLLPILKNYKFKNSDEKARIRPVLASICFVTADKSSKYEEFVELSDRILFDDTCNEFVEVDVNEEASHTRSNLSINRKVSSVIFEASGEPKPRSKTLPKSKSVKWENLNFDDTELVNV